MLICINPTWYSITNRNGNISSKGWSAPRLGVLRICQVPGLVQDAELGSFVEGLIFVSVDRSKQYHSCAFRCQDEERSPHTYHIQTWQDTFRCLDEKRYTHKYHTQTQTALTHNSIPRQPDVARRLHTCQMINPDA